jgi:energy-converting hydrogenase A subunit R
MKFICFDLEGPLSPQDNAYELMGLLPHGRKIFEILSRYDDLLVLERRKGYEPGSTLALITPFLIYHGISEDAMRGASRRATLVDGAHELIRELQQRGWWTGDITTCYEQYGYPITQKIGIPPENVACTRFILDQLRSAMCMKDLATISQLEKDILRMKSRDDNEIKRRLDSFFWDESVNPNICALVKMVKPLGGLRKVKALRRFAMLNQLPMSSLVVVGDSITDSKMLNIVKRAGGLAVAFNANEYALPYATIGLASTSLYDLKVVLEAWEEGGRQATEAVVREKEKVGGTENRGYFHWLIRRRNLAPILAIHMRIRQIVREQASKLG